MREEEEEEEEEKKRRRRRKKRHHTASVKWGQRSWRAVVRALFRFRGGTCVSRLDRRANCEAGKPTAVVLLLLPSLFKLPSSCERESPLFVDTNPLGQRWNEDTERTVLSLWLPLRRPGEGGSLKELEKRKEKKKSFQLFFFFVSVYQPVCVWMGDGLEYNSSSSSRAEAAWSP